MVLRTLREQWNELCSGPPPLVESTLDAILASYAAPTRRYHGTKHVIAVVERVNDLAKQPLWSDPSEASIDVSSAVLAAWYHDVVYDSMLPGNEEASAVRAQQELSQLDIDPAQVEHVAALVRMTAHHRPTDVAGALLADADLWTLGGAPEEYFAYGKLIRMEYQHVPEPAWISGRGTFIRSFLNRAHIFATPRGRHERESQARLNLEAELARLPSP